MQTDGWKPGPPPLDKAGRYDTELRDGTRIVLEVADAPLVRPPGKTVYLEGRIVSVEKRQPPRIDEEPDPRDAEIDRLRKESGE